MSDDAGLETVELMNITNRTMMSCCPTVVLSDSLARSAYKSHYLEVFWSSYLPNGRALSSRAVHDTLGGWTNTIQTLYSTDVNL
jgi:hypothetical protein